MATALPHSPACERNQDPILRQLREFFPAQGAVLEIGSGTGQHAVYFAAAFPRVNWQASDCAESISALQQRFELEGSANLLPPLMLDAGHSCWPDGPYQAAFSANTAHIMAWSEVCAMLAGVGRVLAPQAPFALYGPFHYNGEHTASSNAAFDRQLRHRNAAMGIRDALQIQQQATISGLNLAQDIAMPANNRLLIFKRGFHEL